jgi:hypothetical protein
MIQPPVGSAPPRPPVLTARSSRTNACMHGASRPAQLQLPESPRVKRATTLRKDCVGTPASRGTSSSIMTPHPTSSWRTAPCWQDGEQAREQHFRSAGASVIQRAYRRMKFVYATFGPMVFCRKEGGPADFGKLAFADRSSLDVANFITISDTTSIEHFTNFTSFCFTGSSSGQRSSFRSLAAPEISSSRLVCSVCSTVGSSTPRARPRRG